MKRPFRQPAQSEKNKWHRPNQPRRFFLFPKTQPKNDRERAERNIEPFNFDQSPFLDDSSVNQPDERGNCRSTRPKRGSRLTGCRHARSLTVRCWTLRARRSTPQLDALSREG